MKQLRDQPLTEETRDLYTDLSGLGIDDFTTFMRPVNGFESDADAYIYVLLLRRFDDGSDWYYIGQAADGENSLQARLRKHIRDPTNIQRTVEREGREILGRKVTDSHRVVGIDRVESLFTESIRQQREEEHQFDYLNPDRYVDFYINEAERRMAYEIAIEKETTNVLGGK